MPLPALEILTIPRRFASSRYSAHLPLSKGFPPWHVKRDASECGVVDLIRPLTNALTRGTNLGGMPLATAGETVREDEAGDERAICR